MSMGNPGAVTLFSDPPPSRLHTSTLRLSTLLVSAAVHGIAFALLTLHVFAQQRIVERFPHTRFAVRFVDIHSTEPEIHPPPRGGTVSGDQVAVARANTAFNPTRNPERAQAPGLSTSQRTAGEDSTTVVSSALPSAGVRVSGSPSATRLTPQRMPAPQTLFQPDLPQPVVELEAPPVPLVVLWRPEKVLPRTIVLPAPDKASIATNRPSLETPIQEENLGDIAVSSSEFPMHGPQVAPSTTSPLVVKGPQETKQIPETSSKQPDPPAPTQLLSLSDMRVVEGKVTVPMVNQTEKTTAGQSIPGQLQASSPAGGGESKSRRGKQSAGRGTEDRTEGELAVRSDPQDAKGTRAPGSALNESAAAAGGRSNPGAVAESPGSSSEPVKALGGEASSISVRGPQGLSGQTGPSGTVGDLARPASDSGASVAESQSVPIHLPRDGQFGVVVVGSSIAEQYPETAEMWSGRMASTVYLRVGQPKSWILQYALPRLDEATSGGAGHIDAPWPYEIVRPAIDPTDLDAEALILHGFVNKEGHFEKLRVVFPKELAQVSRIESVLNQWQFRPAKRGGDLVSVEVLLIIPDESN